MTAALLTETALHRLLNLTSYEYFGQVTDVNEILSTDAATNQSKKPSSNNFAGASDDYIQSSSSLHAPKWNYNDTQYVQPVLKLFNELAQYQSADFKCGTFVLYIDIKEKNAIKLILSLLPFAQVVDCGTADYWLNINDTPLRVIEFKTKTDWNGTIGGRSSEQKFKMKQLPIPVDHIVYVIQESNLNPKHSKGVDSLEGAAVNAELRDGFRVKHTQCFLHTILHLLKCIKKAEEFREVHRVQLSRQPKCTPFTFRPLAAAPAVLQAGGNSQNQVDHEMLAGSSSNHSHEQELGKRSHQQELDFIKAYGAGRKKLDVFVNNKVNEKSDDSVENENEEEATAGDGPTLNQSPYVTYCRMLMVVPGMTDKKATKIATVYPTMQNLIHSADKDVSTVCTTIANLSLPVANAKKRNVQSSEPIDQSENTTTGNKIKRKPARAVSEVRRFGNKFAEKILTLLEYSVPVNKPPKRRKIASSIASSIASAVGK